MALISVNSLIKEYKIYDKKPGFWGSIKALYSRNYRVVKAVDTIDFEIDEGELIGFIGPNGAGKTTTLKCLSGLLYPDGGEVSVLGYTPFERNYNFLKQISLVMGQKNQLWWDLPAAESFILNKAIYEIPDKEYQKTYTYLVEMLDVAKILNVQVRKLSLGERMKCELIASLLHSPKILFLDEPTIGLDVVMQKKIREFIKDYNRKFNATIILTSHYMDDVKELCKRVIIIDHGKLLFDGMLEEVIKKFADYKVLDVVFGDKITKSELEKLGKVEKFDLPQATIRIDRDKASQQAGYLLRHYNITDLNIEEPPIEDVIRDVFTGR